MISSAHAFDLWFLGRAAGTRALRRAWDVRVLLANDICNAPTRFFDVVSFQPQIGLFSSVFGLDP